MEYKIDMLLEKIKEIDKKFFYTLFVGMALFVVYLILIIAIRTYFVIIDNVPIEKLLLMGSLPFFLIIKFYCIKRLYIMYLNRELILEYYFYKPHKRFIKIVFIIVSNILTLLGCIFSFIELIGIIIEME